MKWCKTHRLHLRCQFNGLNLLDANNSIGSFDHPGVLGQVLGHGKDLRLGATQGQMSSIGGITDAASPQGSRRSRGAG